MPETSPDAVCWCIIGAQMKARYMLVAERVAPIDDMQMEADTAHNWLRRPLPSYTEVYTYNDNRHRTKGEVIALFENAIADARKELSL